MKINNNYTHQLEKQVAALEDKLKTNDDELAENIATSEMFKASFEYMIHDTVGIVCTLRQHNNQHPEVRDEDYHEEKEFRVAARYMMVVCGGKWGRGPKNSFEIVNDYVQGFDWHITTLASALEDMKWFVEYFKKKDFRTFHYLTKDKDWSL